MIVLDFEDHSWFLLSKGKRLFLDVNCNHSFVGYDFLIELNDEEVQQFKREGRDFIMKIADNVQYSAPGVLNSSSEYKERGLQNIYGDEVTEAIRVHRASN
jgi:hypothetical protein